jgi:hypothetical protein
MKKTTCSSATSKKPIRAPLGLRKLELNSTPKNACFTNSAPSAKAATTHSNTITDTDKCIDSDTSIDLNNCLDSDTSINRRSHFDDDIDELMQGYEQFARKADASEGMSPPIGESFDPALIAHVGNCLCLDTVGLAYCPVDKNSAKQFKHFGPKNIDGKGIPGEDWAKSSLQGPSGKRSLIAQYVPATRKLTIEGSNAMHRQGHNVVASGDMIMTAYSMAHDVQLSSKMGWPVHTGYQIAHGNDIEVTRIDVVLLLRVPQGVSKAEFLNALAISAIAAGRNIGLYSGESVYFDQASQLEAFKIYDKAAELRRSRKAGLPKHEGVEELVELNERTVRVEFVFRAKRLEQIAKKHGGRPFPRLFTKVLLAKMVLTLLRKLRLDGDLFRRLESTKLSAIPLPYRSTFVHWRNGEDLSLMVTSERVLKTHKAYLKKNFNINLNAPSPRDDRELISLAETLNPTNFVPVPESVRNNPELFYELDMEEKRKQLKKRVGPGISSAVIDPYRAPDARILLNGEVLLI